MPPHQQHRVAVLSLRVRPNGSDGPRRWPGTQRRQPGRRHSHRVVENCDVTLYGLPDEPVDHVFETLAQRRVRLGAELLLDPGGHRGNQEGVHGDSSDESESPEPPESPEGDF